MADAGGMPENAAEIAVANAINNINGRNRVLAAGAGGAAAQNNMMNMRDRLFHAIYFRVAATYAELVPRNVQLAIEYLLLLKALVFFFTLVYVHTAFVKNPCTCLQNVQNWPRDGVIRVEIIPYLAEKRAIWERIKADQQIVLALKHTYYYGIGPQTVDNHYRLKRYETILRKLGMPVRPNFAYGNETLYHYFDAINILDNVDHPSDIPIKAVDDDDEQYIVEYSLEYGHLRLSPATRKRLNIPVLTVQLDPNTNECFGDDLTRYLLKNLLGYDDLLMASVRTVAEKEENKGYLRNVITGEHYRFVSMWWAAWSSYPAAFCVMLLFTFSVSMLLRYSHHQIFVFIVDLLQMLEYNVTARFPIAPLLTVILALVGMEAIMSEFFNDTTTAFYIILIVWIADQFDAICCHTSITKRHWLSFSLFAFSFLSFSLSLSLSICFLFAYFSSFFCFYVCLFVYLFVCLPTWRATEQEMGTATEPGVGAAAETAPDKQWAEDQKQEQEQEPKLDLDLGQAGKPKMLKNINSIAADIINTPDTIEATLTSAATTTEPPLQSLAKQLANNLPAQRTQQQPEQQEQQTPSSSSGEKQNSPLQAKNIRTADQQWENKAAATPTSAAAFMSKQSRADESQAEPGAAGAATGATVANPSTMMDGRQTVDFIEGDSFTSTANYNDANATTNHMAQERQQQQQKWQQQQHEQGDKEEDQKLLPKLMKTQPHTSSQVTTAAEAATANN
ncbi:GH22064 [Drosophila grimshawi]|uniref:GH22064 n=1 Tax=Drosophila grimshawi TaxID=7222 RepID=B4J9X7_DROGR|nr:GH22064 [Drosophila grimshawi]